MRKLRVTILLVMLPVWPSGAAGAAEESSSAPTGYSGPLCGVDQSDPNADAGGCSGQAGGTALTGSGSSAAGGVGAPAVRMLSYYRVVYDDNGGGCVAIGWYPEGTPAPPATISRQPRRSSGWPT